MSEPSYDPCLVEAELRARSAYAGPKRHYHDQRHLEDCLRRLDGVAGLGERDRRRLRWAILWHDSVYEPGVHGNEERSAELAQRELTDCGVDPEDAAEVARLIRLTASHRCEPGDRLGALLISIDLSVLGADADGYRQYAEAVRAEYGHVPDAMWQAGRAEVLRRMLAADPLFPDPDFRARLEQQARRNLQAELSSLDEG